MLVQENIDGLCWICRSNPSDSKEHKFKASDLRRQFRAEKMVVGRFNDSSHNRRTAQGVDSKYLKFKTGICLSCNSDVTQESDIAYDEFIRAMELHIERGENPKRAMEDDRFKAGAHYFVPLFRYFAKLLGCHLSELRAPIPSNLAQFVLKKTSACHIVLSVRNDETYQKVRDLLSPEPVKYAAHGGLVVVTKLPYLLPTKIHSALSIGSIQMIYQYILNQQEVSELQVRFPEFVRLCTEQAQKEIDSQSNPHKWSRLEFSGYGL